MKFNNYLKVLLFVIVGLQLFGCVYSHNNMLSSYELSPNDKNGLVAFTVSCNIGSPNVVIGFSPTGSVVKSYESQLHCNSPEQDLSDPELIIMSLPPGTYYFNSIRTDDIVDSRFIPRYFTVTAGKLNYLGWIQLQAGYDMKFKIIITNAIKRDILLIKQYVSPLNENQILISIDKYVNHIGVKN